MSSFSWMLKSVISGCCNDFKAVYTLCSLTVFRRFSFQGRINGILHFQQSRTIVLSSSRKRNEHESYKGERGGQKTVLLVDKTGCQQGEMSLTEALRMAREKSLELVWVNKNDKTAVPVYRMMSKLDIRIKARSLKPPKTKKIEVTDKIESHDLKFRVKRIQQYLEKGHQVKLFVKNKRRTSSEDKLDIIKKVQQEIEGAKVERPVEETPQLISCIFKPSRGASVKANSSEN
ncbi:translation initiation factor IF-3-like [Oculina patagonica]